MSSLHTREAIVSPLSDGHFRLVSASDAHPLTPIVFSNRKAARNWALGKGYQVRMDAARR
ncbi:MAG TPA: hypothetical protein VK178_17015 [Opitutaceae bacterium]|nr:hypothetical protein [Opitutaceae bacterium]HLP09864.1 hypothetical protein [Opitutaceae bacterium]